jgi:hypothetical protein
MPVKEASMSRSSLNRPGATNPPQHLFDEQAGVDERQLGAGAPSAAPEALPDPGSPPDPHPAEEEHPFLARHPGGAHPPVNSPEGDHDIGPNPALHDGTAPPRPHNAGSGPR